MRVEKRVVSLRKADSLPDTSKRTIHWAVSFPKVLNRHMPKKPKITAALNSKWSTEYGQEKSVGNL